MQQNIQPLEEKLAKDGGQPYTTLSAMLALQEKIAGIKAHDLAVDLLPMLNRGRSSRPGWRLSTRHLTGWWLVTWAGNLLEDEDV